MYKAERLFQLVVLPRRSRTVTARNLAVELGVSECTIYRDIRSLILSGVPVEGEAGVGYILRRAFRNFHVYRMEAVVVTDKPFLTEPGKILEEYISAIEKEIG